MLLLLALFCSVCSTCISIQWKCCLGPSPKVCSVLIFIKFKFSVFDYSLSYCLCIRIFFIRPFHLVTVRCYCTDWCLVNRGSRNVCSVNIYWVEKCSLTKKVSETLIEDIIIQILLKPLHFISWLSFTYQLFDGWNRAKFLHLAGLMDKSELVVTVDVTLSSWSCVLRMFCGASVCPDHLKVNSFVNREI
jgi:hypothetical protein